MMATMYDASLDEIYPLNWNLEFFQLEYKNYGIQEINFYTKFSEKLVKIDLNPLYFEKENSMELCMMRNMAPPPPPPPACSNNVWKEIFIGDEQSINLRTDFRETVFFKSQLKSNNNGEFDIKFTIPESLTKWKMLGFVHTKDLKYGFVEKNLITQKQLMVVPNIPRFFRENDTIVFPVKINNLSSKNLNGTAKIKFYNQETGKEILIFDRKETASKLFKIEANNNILITYKLIIPSGISEITYKITAQAGNLSDGEQKTIPVLPNKILITESIPISIRKNETQNINFEKLTTYNKSSNYKPYRLVLELSSNPVWYCIQSLPYLTEFPHECAEQTFSRLYANSIASNVMNKIPNIRRTIDNWKGNKESLLSNLEKNQELKTVFLQETPWITEAKNESEQKKNLLLLFDINRLSKETKSSFEKLKSLQTASGGWAWFGGMKANRFISQHILAGFGHLRKLNVLVTETKEVKQMINSGIYFIDKSISEQYKANRKTMFTNNSLTYEAIHYLYARSFYLDKPIPKYSIPAFIYYKKQLKENWKNLNIYAQGMTALALYRFGEKETADAIVKSLREKSTNNKQNGMFWKENEAGFYWYNSEIETQTMMIEVFSEIEKDSKTVENMIVWLLKQKQTTDWKSTKATTEVVYALLLQGSKLFTENKDCKIKVGSNLISTNDLNNNIEEGTR